MVIKSPHILSWEKQFFHLSEKFFEFFYRGVKTLVDLETLNGYQVPSYIVVG